MTHKRTPYVRPCTLEDRLNQRIPTQEEVFAQVRRSGIEPRKVGSIAAWRKLRYVPYLGDNLTPEERQKILDDIAAKVDLEVQKDEEALRKEL